MVAKVVLVYERNEAWVRQPATKVILDRIMGLALNQVGDFPCDGVAARSHE